MSKKKDRHIIQHAINITKNQKILKQAMCHGLKYQKKSKIIDALYIICYKIIKKQ